MQKIMNFSTTNKKMKKVISSISSFFILGSFFILPSYATQEASIKYDSSGKYGHQLIVDDVIEKENFSKNHWIRTRRRKIPCGQPNVVGIQSVSSALLIASTPQPIPDFKNCPIIRLG